MQAGLRHIFPINKQLGFIVASRLHAVGHQMGCEAMLLGRAHRVGAIHSSGRLILFLVSDPDLCRRSRLCPKHHLAHLTVAHHRATLEAGLRLLLGHQGSAQDKHEI
jgi:S-adenosylmethionine:diacylglycerol 3-amino-3-carboxypropyl transferase